MKFYLLSFFLFLICANTSSQTLPDNMYADTTHAPFLYGVASGDPLQNQLIIWTKVEALKNQAEVEIFWEIAEDSIFTKSYQTGKGGTGVRLDYTVKVDVANLLPNTNYYYRFFTKDKQYSVIGMGKTLPAKEVSKFKLAVVSCSSVWSGYFNAFRQIAKREDIDFVIHLGDYAYDYPDKDELYRMPTPYPVDVSSLAEWRERHTYYLLDPDLRAVRQNKTWIAVWDNHDVDCEAPGTTEEAIKVFYEYLPIRVPNEQAPQNIYRKFSFGNLADLVMTDMFLFRGKEKYETEKKSVWGNEQDAWIKEQLKSSKAIWKIIGNQEMMGSWLSEGAPKFLKLPGNGKYFDPGCWDGYPDDRARFYHFLDSNKINNTVVLTGDAHMSFITDLAQNPKDKKSYNPKTGKGAVGVELVGPSITRGNMDESGVPKAFMPLVQSMSKNLNPHHVWCQFSKHGYVTLEVTPERCKAEFWYMDILKKTDKQKLGRAYEVRKDANHWNHKPLRRKKD